MTTDTRTRIVQQHFQAIWKDGFQAIRTDKVIQELGITKGAFYHYFPTKLDIGYAVVDEFLSPLYISPFEKIKIEFGADPITGIIEHLEEHQEGMSPERAALGCPLTNLAMEMSGLDEGFHTRINAIYEGIQHLLNQSLIQGQQAGNVTATVQPARLAWHIIGSLQGAYAIGKVCRSHRYFNDNVDHIILYLETLRGNS